jgi:hypothetical protein
MQARRYSMVLPMIALIATVGWYLFCLLVFTAIFR